MAPEPTPTYKKVHQCTNLYTHVHSGTTPPPPKKHHHQKNKNTLTKIKQTSPKKAQPLNTIGYIILTRQVEQYY